MGKTIGIKLADGSFFPIIESGAKGSKILNLTTVRDDQPEVHIDLFSSADVEMKEAEHVTTLQLDQLEPHPAGDLDINFLISIDENDTLSAEISEPTSGIRSVKQIPQISQATAATVTPDFALVETKEQAEKSEVEEETKEQVEKSEVEEETKEQVEKSEAEDKTEEIKPEAKTDDFTLVNDLPDFDFDLIEPESSATLSSGTAELQPDKPATQSQEEPKTPVVEDAVAEDEEDVFSFLDETPVEENIELPEDIAIDLSNLDLILSEDEANIAATDTSENQEPVIENSLTINDDDFAFLDDDTEIQNVAETTESVNFYSGLGLPADDSMPAAAPIDDAASPLEEVVEPETIASPEESIEPDSDVSSEETAINEDEFSDTASSSLAELFDEVKATSEDMESEVIEVLEKRGRLTAAVITCIICTLLCVGALIVVCFFLPSKSVFGIKNSQAAEIIDATSLVVETPAPPVETVRIVPEPVAVEPPEPAPVVPAPPPPPPATPDAVRYRLRWGDTLWDLAGTYYNNPWLYRRIAQYNGIQNPGHIVSGTDILIPPR